MHRGLERWTYFSSQIEQPKTVACRNIRDLNVTLPGRSFKVRRDGWMQAEAHLLVDEPILQAQPAGVSLMLNMGHDGIPSFMRSYLQDSAKSCFSG